MLFVKRLYLRDCNRGSMQSREVVQTFNKTSLSDRAAYRVWDLGILRISRQNAKILCPCAPKCQASRVKYYSTVLP